jgi:hypothetical protein
MYTSCIFVFLFHQLPVENDTFEAIGSWCCVSGTVTATLKLEKKGFAVKEAIPVWAEIKNLSTRRICSTQVSLIQVCYNVE